MTIDEVLADYPDLERDDLLAALEYGELLAGGPRTPLDRRRHPTNASIVVRLLHVWFKGARISALEVGLATAQAAIAGLVARVRTSEGSA